MMKHLVEPTMTSTTNVSASESASATVDTSLLLSSSATASIYPDDDGMMATTTTGTTTKTTMMMMPRTEVAPNTVTAPSSNKRIQSCLTSRLTKLEKTLSSSSLKIKMASSESMDGEDSVVRVATQVRKQLNIPNK